MTSNLVVLADAAACREVEEEDDEDEDEDEDVEDIDDDSSNVDATAHPDMPDPIMATLILRASTGGG